MIIAEHHRAGHPLSSDTAFKPACAWPEKCYVQWGSSGVVLAKAGNYRTAFFEAFPDDNAGGFIRGEGADLAAAEKDAFAKYQREVACEHRWGRLGYLNGGALCYRCKAFSTVFQPVHELGDWRRPLNPLEVDYLSCEAEPSTEKGRALRRKLVLRKRLFGVAPRATPLTA